MDTPSTEPFSRVLTALTRIAGWRARTRVALVAASFALACAADLLTPVELSLACFYLVPLAIATWAFGDRPGFLLAIAAGTCALAVEKWGVQPYSSDVHAYWAAGVRITLFAAFVWALDQVKVARSVLLIQSQRDGLTGLYNRRAFTELAQAELRRAKRYGRPTSVVFLDVDDFKEHNDVHGHLEGDRVLATLGRVLQSGRTFDVAARMGGDEFVLLMPETGGDAALAVLERVRQLVVEELRQVGQYVTFTAGVATFEVAPDTVADILRAADDLLYEGKRTGKDSVRARTLSRAAHPTRTNVADLSARL
jgi:diguanylate cyclase (GGDEF)-like protein